MDNQQMLIRTRCRMLWILRMYFLCFGRVVLYWWLYKRIMLYKISIRSVYVINFNVSSTKLMHMLSILDTLSMGITRHLQIVQLIYLLFFLPVLTCPWQYWSCFIDWDSVWQANYEKSHTVYTSLFGYTE